MWQTILVHQRGVGKRMPLQSKEEGLSMSDNLCRARLDCELVEVIVREISRPTRGGAFPQRFYRYPLKSRMDRFS